ncbi:MAG: Flp family type IVb pilin [Candidatus Eremiobacteraeota bacterium]|nr:Flp family type IVb pilin [Candidatus Eremiobacteraeota bacterium]
MKTSLITLVRDDSGATLVEYGLLLALIAVVSIAVLTTLGGKIKTMFSNVNTAI